MGLAFNDLTLSGGIQFRWPPVSSPTIGTATAINASTATVSYTGLPGDPNVYSAYFAPLGAGRKLQVAHNTSFNLGSSAFTIECWIYIPSFPTNGLDVSYAVVQKGSLSTSNFEYSFMVYRAGGYNDQNGQIVFAQPSGATITMTVPGSTRTVTTGAWHHVAWSGTPSTFSMFVDGVAKSSNASGTFTAGSGPVYVGYGYNNGVDDSFNGYISNFRFIKGTALYTTGFTPPTTALDAVPDTMLLTCNSSTPVDFSPNKFTVTATSVTTSSSTKPDIASANLLYDPTVSYTATSSPGGITGTLTQSGSGTITVSGLSDNTNYTFTVRANNDEGDGPESSPSNQITTPAAPPGQQAYTTAGTYTWIAPAGVTSVSAVVIGAGGHANAGGGYIAGAGGGALAFKNNYSVTPGSSYTVVVGAAAPWNSGSGGAGGNSYFVSTSLCFAMGGQASGGARATYLGDGGGNGGLGTTSTSNYGGNGGAGGYSGQGGDGGGNAQLTGYNGAGGGGGGGGAGSAGGWGGDGGGVGILGEGTSGAGGARASAGSQGSPPGGSNSYNYGGGVGMNRTSPGAVRIIWPGTSRQFPSTNTGDL